MLGKMRVGSCNQTSTQMRTSLSPSIPGHAKTPRFPTDRALHEHRRPRGRSLALLLKHETDARCLSSTNVPSRILQSAESLRS